MSVEQVISEKWISIPKRPRQLFALGKNVPFQVLRERYFEVYNKLSSERVSVPSRDVLDFFVKLETSLGRTPDSATQEAIRFHTIFSRHLLATGDMGRIVWYFDPDPNHISYLLTNGGRDRNLLDVANNYINGNNFPSDKTLPWRENDLESMLAKFRAGESFPPVILSERPRGMRPDGDLHIIDGVHRLLAIAIHSIESGEMVSQRAFIA